MSKKQLLKSFYLGLVTTTIIGTIGVNAHVYADTHSDSHSHSDHHIHGSGAADEHAPIGVMGDHIHQKGKWMTSYRYGRMDMDGNRDGTSSVSTDEVLDDFVVAPLDMTMDMHMAGIMYGATDELTITAMIPYIEKSMNHVNRAGVSFKTNSEGLGDIRIGGNYNLYDSGMNAKTHRIEQQLLLNFGLSLPTGSTDERDDTPAGSNQKLPYPMQLGSGTFDPIIGLTYLNKKAKWSWGAQTNAIFRFDENDEGYRLGNEYAATSWVARNLNKNTSVSLRLDGRTWDDIKGEDSELNPMMVPTARTDLRGGERIDALIGVNFIQAEGKLAGNRLAAEFGVPIYQDLDGPQLETDYRLTLGWQYSF